ncbi:DUF443 family protein [Listeria welshimeri]|uniref:DUF443 family protein n=1 Tax=Listeria welshimeri TaxID=1643 RepID=UPI001629FF6E|nr:DUF443 family protein [Listeria welshimeri]EEO6566224.1 DUF443 domain-containing protein [Listeria monocytogenes]MBC1461015.1 DUF443 domain-containing protein [Listeria welshimeri]MBC1703127.1 DUF443 domain-containing protein [Listeria welshimeri]MBC1712530.1 DUF443 domain-containing protein [Listeria welshimeri]MBC1782514.1 DUF443 domain-containing protein [Listeria welshimeri]
MKSVDVEGIYQNIRYRIIHSENEVYLLDLDSPFLFLLFPFLSGIFTRKVYIIDSQIASQLAVPDEVKEKQKASLKRPYKSVLVIFIIFLIPLYRKIAFQFHLSIGIEYLAFTLLFFLIILMRVLISKNAKKKLQEKVNLESFSYKKIKIKPMSFKYKFLITIFYFFLLAMVYISLLAQIKSSQSAFFLVFIIVIFFLSYLNVVSATDVTSKSKIKCI